MSQIVGLHRLGVNELKYEWTLGRSGKRASFLRQHQEVHMPSAWCTMKTTTGLLNPVHEIAEVVDNQNRVFVLDAVGALAGETIDIARSHIYGRGDGEEVYSGVSGRLVRAGAEGVRRKMRSYPKRSWYLHDPLHPTTGAGHDSLRARGAGLLCLRRALNELLEEGVPQSNPTVQDDGDPDP
ncbi:MAG: hypothetical protein P0120_05820 [Nitrospira sp.]|nr:hypothetical protein [Nitrospira sp.]